MKQGTDLRSERVVVLGSSSGTAFALAEQASAQTTAPLRFGPPPIVLLASGQVRKLEQTREAYQDALLAIDYKTGRIAWARWRRPAAPSDHSRQAAVYTQPELCDRIRPG